MNKDTKGLSDKDVEKAWESLENEPFTTNSSGEQVLDNEDGWFGFDKGTTQQEICKTDARKELFCQSSISFGFSKNSIKLQ